MKIIHSLCLYLFYINFLILVLCDEPWANTQETTLLWQFISQRQNQQFHQFLIEQPRVITMRSVDGRGALWWAWEYDNAEALAILAVNGEDIHHTKTDAEGNRPMDLSTNYETVLAGAQSMVKDKMSEKQYIEEQIKLAKEQMYFNEDELEEEDEEDWEEDEEDEDEYPDDEDDDVDADMFRDEF